MKLDLSKYVGLSPEFGPLGEIVYLRTYARWNEAELRRETWKETVQRVAEWSANLASERVSDEEVLELFDQWANLKAFPAGRSLWTAGTEYAKSFGLGSFNCSFTDIRRPRDFYDMTFLLMSGAGVGFRVTRDNVAAFNANHPLTEKPAIEIEPYYYVGRAGVVDETQTVYRDEEVRIIVGDSRAGWATAIESYINAVTGLYGPCKKISVNVDYVRPLGTPLKTFGGYASGPEPLIGFINDATTVLQADDRGWTSVKLLDLGTMIGRTVVAGGSRRSACIALGDADDYEFLEAKTGNWYETAPWRSQANNSVIFHERPTADQLRKILNLIAEYGEPGFINGEEANRRRPNWRGLNPCAEILLDNQALCNLTTINMMAFVENGRLKMDELEKTIKLQARHNLRVTCINIELPEWDAIQKRDRLLGMSITGWGDFLDATDMNEEGQKRLLEFMRTTAHNAANEYADELGIPRPLLITAIKPEGCWTKEYLRTTDQGLLLLDEINPDIFSQVGAKASTGYTVRGNKVTNTYAAEKQPIVKVTLQNGRVLKMTAGHPISVNGEWTEAARLCVGQIIDSELGTYVGQATKLKQVESDGFRSDARAYKTPAEMTADLAWLLGVYFGDGSFPIDDKTNQCRIKLIGRDLSVHKKVQRIWLELFGVETTICRCDDRDAYTQDFASVYLRRWFAENQLDKESYAYFDRLPLAIRTSSAEHIIAFLAGLTDADGCYYAKSMCIDNKSEAFIRHIQEVGEAVGLSFGFSANVSRGGSFSKKPMYKVHLSRTWSKPEAISELNRHSARGEEIVEGNGHTRHPYKVKSIELDEEDFAYDIEVETDHWYYQGGLKSHNTITQLPGVSSGVHPSFGPYYIRRIRIAAVDAVAETMKQLGYKWEVDLFNPSTLVFEIPVATPAKKYAYEYTALEMLDRYKLTMKHYVDHNTSITVYMDKDEINGIIEWLLENWDDYVAVSFLPKSDDTYPQMPYERITKEQYEELVATAPFFDRYTLEAVEYGQMNAVEDFEVCSTGACPTR